MDQTGKNIWADEVMDSLAGMQRVASPANMYEKVMGRVKNGRGNARRLMPAIAAAAVVLLVVNIASVFHAANTRKAAQQQGVSQVIDDQINSLADGY